MFPFPPSFIYIYCDWLFFLNFVSSLSVSLSVFTAPFALWSAAYSFWVFSFLQHVNTSQKFHPLMQLSFEYDTLFCGKHPWETQGGEGFSALGRCTGLCTGCFYFVVSLLFRCFCPLWTLIFVFDFWFIYLFFGFHSWKWGQGSCSRLTT